MPQTIKQEPPAREIASARKTITEQDRQLAESAFSHFKSGSYDHCFQLLKRLAELRPHDARVAANKAVVEYYVSKLCKSDDFIKQLSAAKKQLEFGMVNTGDELDDIDRSFLLYNQAVLHFHLKQYKAAINILKRLFKIIEPLGDFLAAKVCTLLVEVYLLNYELEEAHGMISYVESIILGPKQMNNGELVNEEQHKLVVKIFQPKLHMFKVRLYMMRGFYNQCKRELKLAMNSSKNSVEALFLKSNIEYIRGNHQKAVKLLNSAPKTASYLETGQPLTVMYYNNLSTIHFALKKYNLGVLYSKKALDENVAIMKSLPPMEKYNHQSGRPLQTLAINRRAELLYNLGLSLLFADKPTQAFDCLLEAQTVYQCNPRYWLRLAECCVSVSQQVRNDAQGAKNKKNEYVQCVTGTGSHRKIVLSPVPHYVAELRQETQSAAMPGATLDFANLCLMNALLLMPSESELEKAMATFLQNERVIPGDDDEEPVKRSFLGRIYVDVPPGDPIQTKEAYRLRASILCCHAYVTLGLTEYHKSIEYSRILLRMVHASSHKRYLARMYLAESLIKLDRIGEAIQELSPENLKSISSFEQDVAGLKCMTPFPTNLNEARALMALNVACAYCLRSEFDKCKHMLRQVVAPDVPANVKSQAILMSVYCDLLMGQVSSALYLIKRNEIFPSGRLIDRVEAARAMSDMQQMSFMQQQMRSMQPPVGLQGGGQSSTFLSGTQSPAGFQPVVQPPGFQPVVQPAGFQISAQAPIGFPSSN